MKRQRFFFLLFGVALLLLAGCNPRTTSTPRPGEPVGPPAPTQGAVAAPTAVATVPPATAGPTQEQPEIPVALTAPQMTVQGTLASGIQWGTTADGNYFKGNPNAPLIIIEFSDYQ